MRGDLDDVCAWPGCVGVVVAWLDGAAWCGHHARDVLDRGARLVLRQAESDLNAGKAVSEVHEGGRAA